MLLPSNSNEKVSVEGFQIKIALCQLQSSMLDVPGGTPTGPARLNGPL